MYTYMQRIYIHKTGVLIWYSTALLAINCVNNQLLNMYLAELSQYFFFDMKKCLSKKFLFFIFFLIKKKFHKQYHEVENCFQSKPVSSHL